MNLIAALDRAWPDRNPNDTAIIMLCLKHSAYEHKRKLFYDIAPLFSMAHGAPTCTMADRSLTTDEVESLYEEVDDIKRWNASEKMHYWRYYTDFALTRYTLADLIARSVTNAHATVHYAKRPDETPLEFDAVSFIPFEMYGLSVHAVSTNACGFEIWVDGPAIC